MNSRDRYPRRSWAILAGLVVVFATLVIALAPGEAGGAVVSEASDFHVSNALVKSDKCLTVNQKALNCGGLGTVHPAKLKELYLLAFRQSVL